MYVGKVLSTPDRDRVYWACYHYCIFLFIFSQSANQPINHKIDHVRVKHWPVVHTRRRRRRSGLAGAGLSLYACLISHFNIVNIVV